MTVPIIPEHIKWEFDGIPFAEISNSPNSTFKFEYTAGKELVTTDLKYAIRKTLTELYSKTNMPLSICISGADSEIIAHEAKYTNIPFELYFLDLWNVNLRARYLSTELSTYLGVKLNIVSLTKEDAFGVELEKNFKKLQAEKPTYLCLPYLLERIPKDTYIIGGEGDPQKSGLDYEPLADENGLYDGIPISITEVFYRQWALENNRACDMYFYSLSPLLLRSYFYHPLIEKKNKRIDTRPVVDSLWPNLFFNYKTTNWEDSIEENQEIRMHVRQFNKGQYKFGPKTVLAKL